MKLDIVKKPKILLIPYPAQGHVAPMINLASIFTTFGFQPVLITPQFIHRRITPSLDPTARIISISIPDGLDHRLDDQPTRDFFAIEKAMEEKMPIELEKVLQKMVEEDGEEVACLVVDLVASWAIEVGHRCGVLVAGFWPAMLATYNLIAAIPEMITSGLISENGIPQHEGPIFLANQPLLSTGDLPWLIGDPNSRKGRFKFWKRMLDRSRNLPQLFVNSFPQESSPLQKQNPNNQPQPLLFFQVGALSKCAKAITKNPSLWEEDTSCLKWLDEQKPKSVMYISFGSWVSPIGEGKVRDLSLALEAMGRPFIWVLGPTWRSGLPFGYLERVSAQGKVICWAPQVKILQHRSVGCFVTHCGWNSTMEAIRCKQRLVCYPVAGDQFINCAYIVGEWRIGVRINGFEREEIEDGVRRVMRDNEISHRLERLCAKTTGEEIHSVKNMNNLASFLHHMPTVIN